MVEQARSPTDGAAALFPSSLAGDPRWHFLLCQAEATAVCRLAPLRECSVVPERPGSVSRRPEGLRELWPPSLPPFSPRTRPCWGSREASSVQPVHTPTTPTSRALLEGGLRPGLALCSRPGPRWSCPGSLGGINTSDVRGKTLGSSEQWFLHCGPGELVSHGSWTGQIQAEGP